MRIYCDEKIWNNVDDDDLGDVWNAVGAVGASAVQLLPQLFGGGSSSAGGPARGLAAIQAAVQQAISSLNQILAGLRNNQMAPAAAISEAQRIVAALSNPAYIYQAQRGNDAEALRDGKSQAAAIFQQIQGIAAANTNAPLANANGVTTFTAGGVPGDAGTSPAGAGSAAIGGIDNSTLLLVGGGLVLLLLLK